MTTGVRNRRPLESVTDPPFRKCLRVDIEPALREGPARGVNTVTIVRSDCVNPSKRRRQSARSQKGTLRCAMLVQINSPAAIQHLAKALHSCYICTFLCQLTEQRRHFCRYQFCVRSNTTIGS